MVRFNLLTRRHPAYPDLEKHWQFLIDTFEGGPAWMSEGNLFKFYKEGDQEYKDRLARAHRDNVSRDVVEIWTSHVFKVPVTRDVETAPPAVVEFWKRASKGRDAVSIDDLMRDACDKSGAVSPIYLVVDMPAIAEPKDGVLTRADAQRLNLRPYCYIVYPTDVLDFGLDDDDEFTWLLMREFVRDDADPFTASGKVMTRYRLWTLTSWHVFEETTAVDSAGQAPGSTPGGTEPGYRLIAEGTHNLGRIPVVQLAHKRGKDRYRATSLIDEIAYKDRAICNNWSRLDEILANQTFSQLFLPDAGLIASTDKTASGRRKKMVEMGTKAIVLFNDKAQHPPMFLSPDAAQAQLLLDVIDRLREQIMDDAMLDSQGGQATGKGGAKTATEASFDFEKLNSALADKAKALEAAERQVAELVCLWTSTTFDADAAAGWIKYPRKFQVKALADELAEALQAKQLGDLGAKFWELYLESLVVKMLPDVTPEELKVITEEIAQSHQLGQMLSFGQMTIDAMANQQAPQVGAAVTGGDAPGG